MDQYGPLTWKHQLAAENGSEFYNPRDEQQSYVFVASSRSLHFGRNKKHYVSNKSGGQMFTFHLATAIVILQQMTNSNKVIELVILDIYVYVNYI